MQNYMGSAFEALVARKYFNKSVQSAATGLVNEAVADSIEHIRKTETIQNEAVKKFALNKLSTLKVSVMFPDEILKEVEIAELFAELPLNGSESLIEMSAEIKKFSSKLYAEPVTSWTKILELINPFFIYTVDENILSKFAFNFPCFYEI